jgi:hypothetical protein
MGTKIAGCDPQLRQQIAQMSARLMMQEGIEDYHLAKSKAASQLGVYHSRHLPSNREIQEEIQIYQRLFYNNSQQQRLLHLRQVALQVMKLFANYSPRLVGSVLNGTASQYSKITLHLFAHNSEEIAVFLLERNIPYQMSEKKFRLSEKHAHLAEINIFPTYRFIAGEETVMLIVFKINDIRWSPPNPVDGKPMARADIKMLERLIQGE